MFQSVLRRFRPKRIPDFAGATAQFLGGALGYRCLRCGQELVGHAYSQIAIVVAKPGTEPTVKQFVELTRKQDWSELRTYQQFEGTEDAVEALAIQCPDKKMYVALIVNPFELYESSWLLDKVIDVEDQVALGSHVNKDEWKLFISAGS